MRQKKEVIALKSVSLGLLVCCLVFFTGGAALAAETVIYIDPDPDDFTIIGAVGDPIILTWHDKMTDEQREALQKILDEFDVTSGNVELASVTFTISNLRGSVTIVWEDGQFIFNFKTGKFDSFNEMQALSAAPFGSEMGVFSTGSGNYIFVKGCDYDGAVEPDKGTFISARFDIEEETRRKKSSGCSALQIGAFVLFMLPALALLRRRKK
jgi:hypothetical protein